MHCMQPLTDRQQLGKPTVHCMQPLTDRQQLATATRQYKDVSIIQQVLVTLHKRTFHRVDEKLSQARGITVLAACWCHPLNPRPICCRAWKRARGHESTHTNGRN